MGLKVSYGPNIVTDSIVLTIDAGNRNSYIGSGTNWNDLSGNVSNGTLTNGPTFNSSNIGSIVFDGVDDYVIGTNVVISSQATLLVWFKTSTAQTNKYLLSLPSNSAGANGFDIYLTTGAVGSYCITNPSNVGNVGYSVGYNDGLWHMVAVSYNGSALTMYWDGVQVNTGSLSGTIKQTGNGEYNVCRFGSFGLYTNANVSYVNVYNRGLTSSEVYQNYYAIKSRYGY